MKADIEGESDDYVKIYVWDNSAVEHDLTINKGTGEVAYHESDGYPDSPADRSYEENEHVAQAQRFAKYWVYRQRGYDTMPPLPNPDRIGAVATFVDALSDDAFEEYFGDFYQQMASDEGRAEPVVDVPPDARENPMFYRKDVYLGLSIDELQSFITESDRSAFEALQTAAETANSTGETSLYGLVSELDGAPDLDDADEQRLAELYIEAVSGVHVMWSPASDHTETVETDVPDIERKPDARFEMPPYDPDSLDDLREEMVYHLKCQMRDCYLTMGVAPPEELRIQGPGWFDRSTWFEHYDVYEPYHRTGIEITDWQEQYTPDDMPV